MGRLEVGLLFANRCERKVQPFKKALAAFTMVEIAISLGVIAIALVAILGVLPTGVRVQKDNREDTILNQEGMIWLETIRSGSRGLNYLTNYVDLIKLRIANSTGVSLSPGFPYAPLAGEILGPALSNGQQIVSLLTYPKYVPDSSGNLITNRVTAFVRAISGSALEKSKSARDMAFAYQLTSEIVPMKVYPTAFTNYLERGLSATNVLIRSNLWRMARNEAQNFYELRLTLQGPVIPKGRSYDVLGTPKTFRTLVSGAVASSDGIVLPSFFFQVP